MKALLDEVIFDIDSGASDHFVNSKKGLRNFDPTKTINIKVADRRKLTTSGKGDIPGKLHQINLVPASGSNQLSIHRLYKEGKATLFHPSFEVLIAKASDMKIACPTPICRGFVEDNSFKIRVKVNKDAKTSYADAVTVRTAKSNSESAILHAKLQMARLGYCSPNRLLELYKNRSKNNLKLPNGLNATDFASIPTDAYYMGRQQQRPHHSLKSNRSAVPFYMVGDFKQINSVSPEGLGYALNIQCYITNWKVGIPCKKKSDFPSVFERWHQQFVVPLGFKVHIIRLDNAKEQLSKEFDGVLTRLGIKAEYTNTYSSASNGKAKRTGQTLTKTMTSIRRWKIVERIMA